MLSTRKGLASQDLQVLFWLSQSELKEEPFGLHSGQNGWCLDHPLLVGVPPTRGSGAEAKEKGGGIESGDMNGLEKSTAMKQKGNSLFE